jgi:uncharacterized RDD family membrane protein YckC
MIQERYRTFWRRFGAGVVDGLILLPITFLDGWFFSEGFSGWINLIYYALFSFPLGYAYYIFMHGRYGQTVGKRVAGVKLLALNEGPLGYKRAFLRDSVPLLLGMGFILYDAPQILQGVHPYDIQGNYNALFFVSATWIVAELVTMLTNNKRRAVHDFIAGSVVVRL